MNNEIARFLEAVGESDWATEVEAMHNRLEAFADGLDKAALSCAIKSAEEAIQQRDLFAEQIATLTRQRDLAVEALHHISLCSQNSMSSQRQCGELARAAIKESEAMAQGEKP